MQKGKGTKEADQAIRDASQGRMEVPKMLKKVLSAQVFVPLSEPPVMGDDKMTSWQPATVTHPERGNYLLAFTDDGSRKEFGKNNPDYNYGLMLDTGFLITILPPGHGILFNMGGESCFEWDRRGIAAYQQTMAINRYGKD